MAVRSETKYLRISPRKVRLVIAHIKNKNAVQALAILENVNKKAARMLTAVLKTCIANAKVQKKDLNALVISDVRANGGPIMKRLMTRSMGRANRIDKRTTHIVMELTEKAKASQSTQK